MPPQDADLCFYLQVYRDYDQAAWCLRQLRTHYPAARVVVLSDGDPDPRFAALAGSHAAEFVPGERLFPVHNGGRMIHRMLDVFLRRPTPWLIRIDTDTCVERRLELPLPAGDVLGTVQASFPFPCVQGGCVAFARSAAERLHARRTFLDPRLLDYQATWAACREAKDRAERLGLISFEWVVCYVARQLELAIREWPEVLSLWTRTPDNPDLWYAIVHPRKLPTQPDSSPPPVRGLAEDPPAGSRAAAPAGERRGRFLPASAFGAVFGSLRGRRVGYVRTLGTVEDALLEVAAFQLMRAFGANARVVDARAGPGDAEEIVVAASDSPELDVPFGTVSGQVFSWGRPVTILPRSFAGRAPLPPARVFVRERESLRFMPGATLAPDLALGLDLTVEGTPDLGSGLWLRSDGDALFPHTPSRGDPAGSGCAPAEYLRLAARHHHVLTDRLHFAIAALLCGRQATLLPSRSPTNRAMYDCWLAPLGCRWAEVPPTESDFPSSGAPNGTDGHPPLG